MDSTQMFRIEMLVGSFLPEDSGRSNTSQNAEIKCVCWFNVG